MPSSPRALLLLAAVTSTACFTGLPDDGGGVPWDMTSDTEAADGSDAGSADGGSTPGSADGGSADGGSVDGGSADGTSASADGGSSVDTGSADGASADGGTVDTGSADGASADGGTVDTGSADGASADGGSADGGTGSADVPDNAFCMEVAAWDAGWADLEEQILVIVNQRRAEGANCGSEGSFGAAGPLTMHPALRCAARVHSMQMVVEGFFDHVTPWGETPWDRMAAAGYNYSTAGENIAGGNATAAATMQQWMDSDGHCANIMNPSFTEIGVGYYPGGQWGHYWTQAFGAP